jgi:hypothetical protein
MEALGNYDENQQRLKNWIEVTHMQSNNFPWQAMATVTCGCICIKNYNTKCNQCLHKELHGFRVFFPVPQIKAPKKQTICNANNIPN